LSDAVAQLRGTVAEWNGTRFELARLATERDGDWRLRTVRLRRKLQDQIAQIALILTHLDVAPTMAGEIESFRRALSALRAQLAMHQASWPAVSIQPDDAEYRASVASLRGANETFAKAAEQLFHHLSPRS